MNDSKIITIFNQKLAGILMSKGFVLIDMRPNKDGSGKNVFFFKDSPNLQRVVEEFSSK